MFTDRLDSYHYVRPIAYRSYYQRQQKPQILKENDDDSRQVLNILNSHGVQYNDLGGLSKGIRFNDLQAGKRVYNFNASKGKVQYYIRQWKPTNQCDKHHPHGQNFETKVYGNFLNELERVLNFRRKV